MKVFLTGATGYIGSVVAEFLLAAGHQVFGLARSEHKAAVLRERGVEPVSGDLKTPAGLRDAARSADGVIHLASPNDATAAELDLNLVTAVLGALEDSSRPFVYTGGIWSYGPTQGVVISDDAPLNPPPMVAWRHALERQVLAPMHSLRSIVIRPGMVYGRGGGIPAMFFRSGEVQYVGDGANRWPMVHVEDLADLYVAALERAPAGSAMLAASGENPTVRELALAAAEGLGQPGQVQSLPLADAVRAMGPFAEALAMDQQAVAKRARQLLGWTPKRLSCLDDLRKGSYASQSGRRAG